ncbi:hypothetical protein HPT29_027705 (plasmid) [Microvirga terrae]|uniref:Uncharacterized protein n=1 Tax=Microvirga terrae TaxID=2740529 RepID=A0ABY5S498_9HYPH|nr:hypothetical protein [Microvirga terrae]UVF22807.1 hypothetical protein HPT29_027705 [Microvirga terrae]
MSAVDFWTEITCGLAFLYCETEAAKSVAFELRRQGDYPARISHSGCGNLVLRTSIDDLDDLVSDLERSGYGVQVTQGIS